MRIILSWRKFHKIFGFTPTSEFESNRPLYYDAEQHVVDGKLTELAEAFRQADRSERAAQRDLNLVATAEELVAARNTHAYYRDGVYRAKEAFWWAHKLAQDAGFHVKEKYTDYLTSGWR